MTRLIACSLLLASVVKANNRVDERARGAGQVMARLRQDCGGFSGLDEFKQAGKMCFCFMYVHLHSQILVCLIG